MSVGSPTAGTWFSSQWRPDNEFETDRNRNTPLSSLTVETVRDVRSNRASTSAPGSNTNPAASVTTPSSVPRCACAHAGAASEPTNNQIAKGRANIPFLLWKATPVQTMALSQLATPISLGQVGGGIARCGPAVASRGARRRVGPVRPSDRPGST